MKNLVFNFLAVSLLFTACNAPKNESKGHDHATMTEVQDSTKNLMMEAMDRSMNAMMEVKATGNVDYDFANRMKPHHDGAVQMAEDLIKESKNEALIAFCKEVIAAQNKEIAQFDAFLKVKPETKSDNSEAYEKADHAAMMVMMKGMNTIKLSNNIDTDFVALMIPHHQSAVEMAKAYLPYANNPEIKKIAEDIIASQTKEIEWLKAKL